MDANSSAPQMASLQTICKMYDWKYDTIWRMWKRGEFVKGYRMPGGRALRFDLRDVDSWAHRCPEVAETPSLVRYAV